MSLNKGMTLVSVSALQENVTLIAEINELRKELHSLRSQVKDYKAQLATLKRSTKARPNSVDGPKKEAKHERVDRE